MSFMKSLKGLADDFKGMMGDKDKDKHKQDASHNDSTRGTSDSYYQQHSQQPPQQHTDHHQQQYGQQPPYQQQSQYGAPPHQDYGAAPSSGQHLPPGWLQQWDQNSQRYYYLNQATGQTQWDPPAMSSDAHRGMGGPPPGQYGGYPPQGQYGGYPPQGQHGYPQQHGYPPGGGQHLGDANFHNEATKSKSSNKNAMLAAGAGGLLVGGVAGAAMAGDSDSDDGHGAGYGAPPAGYGGQPGYGAPPPGDPQPGDPSAQALEHNSDVSSSQRESLEEAREDYEEAQRAAADSDASSSDHEEAREAREEYEEELEEAQEEADD